MCLSKKLCQHQIMRSMSLNAGSVLFVITVVLFGLLGFYLDQMGFLALALFSLFSFSLLIWIVPISWSLPLAFFYIGIEGFLKVVSNYHPLVHVGADVLIFVIYLKIFFEILIGRRKFVARSVPFTTLFVIHFIWLFIVLFHPYSIGFIPAIAGSKVYAIMVSLYFLAYYFCDTPDQVRRFMWVFVIISMLHVAVSVYQIALGPISVTMLHPRYSVLLLKFNKLAFRPFGLTNLPGAPAVYLYPVVPFLFYFLYFYRSWLIRSLIIVFIPFAAYVFLHCQVRSAILKALLGLIFFIIGLILSYKYSPKKIARYLIFNSIVLACAIFYVLPSLTKSKTNMADDDAQMAYERSLSVFDLNTITEARRGVWYRFEEYVKMVPFGAGFSRVGGASGAFKEYAEKDPHFGYSYFFTDNFWLACLVEVGIPGMILMTLLVFCLLYKGFSVWWKNRGQRYSILQLTLFSSLLSMVFGLYGAEGILYNPDSCFYWFFSGALIGSETWSKSYNKNLDND